jgi:hypothetical protein
VSWSVLWTVVFFAAFAAFTWVSLLIAVRGIHEIRELIVHLETGFLAPDDSERRRDDAH